MGAPETARLAGQTDPASALTWALTPPDAFQLTILGVDRATVVNLKSMLDEAFVVHPTSLYMGVAELVTKTGLRCKQIADYVAKYHTVWASGRQPDIYPYCDLDALFEGNQLGAPGTELTAKYQFSNLRFYCRQSEEPRPVPQAHRDRERWMALVRVGLATVGPPMTKRGKTGEAFRTVPLKISKDVLCRWIDHCTAVGEIITLTYAHSVSSVRSAKSARDPAIAEILKGYKVTCVGDDCTCRYCARTDGKKYPVGQEPRTPFHIGCRCVLLEIFA